MRRSILAAFLVVSFPTLAAEPAKDKAKAPVPEAPASQVVTATGEAPIRGNNVPGAKAEAHNAALRAAVQQVCGTFVTSFSETKDFTLLQDVVATRTSGYVTERAVLKEEVDEEGQVVRTTLRATVARAEMDKDAAAVATLMSQKRQRRIFVLIDDSTPETVGGQVVARHHGILDQLLREALREDGFYTLDPNVVDGKLETRPKVAALSQQEAAKIAQAVEADVIIYGYANVTFPEPVKTGPVDPYCDQKTVYCTQVEIVLSVTTPEAREQIAGLVESAKGKAYSSQGAITDVLKAGSQKAMRNVRLKLFEAWRRQVMDQQRIKMVVTGLPSYRAFQDLQAALLGQVAAVKEVSSARFNKGTGSFDLLAASNPEALANELNNKAFKGLKLSVQAVTNASLELAVVAGK